MEHAFQPRTIDVLLARYAESHRHPVNEVIHCVCIPAIMFSLLGILWAIHPILALLVVLGALAWYVRLSLPFAIGMAVMAFVMLGLLQMMPSDILLAASIGVFVVAWIGQLIGHHIEGKKPSFFEDLRFLLVGPLFVLGLLYRRVHIAY